MSARIGMRRDRRGVALFAALWLVVAIGVVALEFSLEARQRRLAAANTVEMAEARAAAMGGIEHAHARLDRMLRLHARAGAIPVRLRTADPWLDADTLVAFDPDTTGARYDVRVTDANAFLNLNSANENRLRLFLSRLGYDYGLADELAQSILDWRDTDELRRARGAERESYIEAGRLVLPRDGAFQEVDELRHVMHMTPEIYDSIRPFLTVRGSGQVNVNSASEPVLASVPGMTDAGIAALVRLRSSNGRITSLAELRSLGGTSGTGLTTGNNGVTFDTRSLIITSTGYNRGGRSPFQVVALITRPAGASTTATVAWRRSR